MPEDTNKDTAILSDLGDGLVLRRSTPADADALADFNAVVHSDDGAEKPDEKLGAWTRDLLTLSACLRRSFPGRRLTSGR